MTRPTKAEVAREVAPLLAKIVRDHEARVAERKAEAAAIDEQEAAS